MENCLLLSRSTVYSVPIAPAATTKQTPNPVFIQFAIMRGRQDVEFQTLDGLTLRGWFFPGAERGPAIIMAAGVCINAPE